MSTIEPGTPEWKVQEHIVDAICVGVLGLVILALLAWLFMPGAGRWTVLQAAHTYAGGWALRLELPTGPPVPVSEYLYESRAHCEESRVLEMQQAYHDRRSVPPLTCAAKYQGWRRLYFTWQAIHARVIRAE